MRIFIDIGHPAHVHYFRNFIKIMQSRGHEFLVTARERKHVFGLLSFHGIKATSRGPGANGLIGKFLYMIKADFFLYRLAREFNPDLFLHFGAVYASHVARMLKKTDVFFDDTENARINQKFYVPFSDLICTPSCFQKNLGRKHFRFNGYMELCYLHPNRFIADESVFNFLEISRSQPYVILRFVSWEAGHDYGHTGLTLDMKRKAVREFSKYAKVFISSEKHLPDDLMPYQIRIPPEMMHSALSYAKLFWGESATMASECAVLGTPAIYIDDEGRGYTDEEEKKYGLVYNFTESIKDQEVSIEKGLDLLRTPNIKKKWQKKREKMLEEKIDVTAFMVWLIENYPESSGIMRENPSYQFNFQ